VQAKTWDVDCCAETVGSTCPIETSCCDKVDIFPSMPPPAPKPSFPPPCLPAPEMWECISNCHRIDNDQETDCKDKCTPCSPLSPLSPSAPPPSAPPQCKDEDPPFCEDELKTDDDKLENCKAQQFKTKCFKTCGYCPSDVATPASALTGSPEADGLLAGSFIASGVAALGVLALLFLASRRSTRAYISSVVGKAFGSAASVKSTEVAVAAPPSVAVAPVANASAAAGLGKGVLLDNAVRQRTGLSWYRPTRAQLLAAPGQEDASEAPAWSALVVNGVSMPYAEVTQVRMDDSALEFIIEHGKEVQHLRMFTRADFNLWREALHPKITNPTLRTDAESKPSAVIAAQKWLANAEA